MLVNRHRTKRELGQCQHCADPRPQPLDQDGRCPVCQFTVKHFLSELEESPASAGGRPLDLSPSVSLPLLLDDQLGVSRAHSLALLFDSCCTPLVLKSGGLPVYSLRLRPLLARWVELNALYSRDTLQLYHDHTVSPTSLGGHEDLGPWSTYHFTRTMDIYILSRLLAWNSMEFRAYARRVVMHLHTKYGPVHEWDSALGVHPSHPVHALVFGWPPWLTIPPRLYGMPSGAPLPEVDRLTQINKQLEVLCQDSNSDSY